MTQIKRGMTPTPTGMFVRGMCIPEDLSMTEIAKHLGVSRQSVYALVNGERRLTLDMAKRIELAFGTSAGLMLRQQAMHEQWLADQKAQELAETVIPFTRSDTAA